MSDTNTGFNPDTYAWSDKDRVPQLVGKSVTLCAGVYKACKTDASRSVVLRHVGYHAYVKGKSTWRRLFSAIVTGDLEFIEARAIKDDKKRADALDAIRERDKGMTAAAKAVPLEEVEGWVWTPPAPEAGQSLATAGLTFSAPPADEPKAEPVAETESDDDAFIRRLMKAKAAGLI